MASCIFSNLFHWSISIPDTRRCDGVVYYTILVEVGSISWSVERRYSEFDHLNNILVREQGIDRDSLPPKRLMGNSKPEFINERRVQLEVYLNKVFQYLVKTMPLELATFLDIDKRDVMFIIRKIPQTLATSGSKNIPTLSVLQVHALSARLKLPCPPADMSGYQHDFCSILEACGVIDSLRVQGYDVVRDVDNPPVMDFIPFKSLRSLVLHQVDPHLLVNADAMRNTLNELTWSASNLTSLEGALVCDSLHKTVTDQNTWSIKKAAFPENCIYIIGDAVTLMPNLIELNVDRNAVESLRGLNNLQHFEKLSIMNNNIEVFENLGLDPSLTNLTWINLSNNNLQSLKGLGGFTCLKYIDVSNNQIKSFSEVQFVCSLRKLVTFILQGNPICNLVDYRVKTLEQFDDRAVLISLDSEWPTRKEMDTIAVVQALRMVKEGRTPL